MIKALTLGLGGYNELRNATWLTVIKPGWGGRGLLLPWDELVLVTPLYSPEGLRASSSKGDSLHRLGSSEERLMLLRSHSRGFQSSGAGDRDYCPKSQNLRVAEMAVTGSNFCVPKTMPLWV